MLLSMYLLFRVQSILAMLFCTLCFHKKFHWKKKKKKKFPGMSHHEPNPGMSQPYSLFQANTNVSCVNIWNTYIKGIVSILQVGLLWVPEGKFLENHFHPLPVHYLDSQDINIFLLSVHRSPTHSCHKGTVLCTP